MALIENIVISERPRLCDIIFQYFIFPYLKLYLIYVVYIYLTF